MAKFIKHTSCARCGSSDANALYDDGSSFCFSCHHSIRSTTPPLVLKRNVKEEEEKEIILPPDLNQEFDEDVYNFVNKYDISFAELIKYDYYYSKRQQSLYRRFYTGSKRSTDAGGTEWSASHQFQKISADVRRLADQSGKKAVFLGTKPTKEAIIGPKLSPRRLVLVEDSLSSIKVARVCESLALFGTFISKENILELSKEYPNVHVWLDRDKFKEAHEIAFTFKILGTRAKVIFSTKDPKYYSEKEIEKYIFNPEKAY